MSAGNSLSELSGVNPEHIGLLNDTLQAPSAHNAQPWHIKPLEDGTTYEIHYIQTDDLPEDHGDKDAYLTMGAFVETMVLEAPNHGLDTSISPELTRDGEDLFIARVALSHMEEGRQIDPLSKWVSERYTNRNRYTDEPLPEELKDSLKSLGNTLIEPQNLKDVVLEASKKSWANPRYVQDLKEWVREDANAEDGITLPPFNITKSDMVALKFAFWRGSIKSKILGNLYSVQDGAMFSSAAEAAVLSVDDMTPAALFDGGRRLLRSWVQIIAAGYSYQPFSVAVDEQSTLPKVAEITGTSFPVALYRIGKATKPPRGYSNRKPLAKVLIHN